MIPSQRHLFDMPRDVAYLNCAYMGPLSHRVRAAAVEGAQMKARPWEITIPDFFGEPEKVRTLAARLLNADAEGIAIIPAASYGLSTAAMNADLGPGRTVVLLADQFPSHVYPWRAAVAERGGEIVTVARPADDDWTAAVLEAIDARAAVVALPHCHWTDGGLVDLAAVRARIDVAAPEAMLALDLTQSAGAMPFDAGVVRPDFAVVAAYKWMLAPYATGFMWVSPRFRTGRPLEHNWIAKQGSRNFARLVDYRDEWEPGARRFDVGERANFAATRATVAALEQVLDWGVAEIAATLSARTAAIAARAQDAFGLTSAPPDRRAGHFLGLRFAEGAPETLVAKLADARVHASIRGSSLRVTPHLYNDDEDVDRLFDALGAALD